MSTTYSVITGDTFESIARKSYGTEQEADRISRANPGVSEPLVAGVIVAIPTLPGAPQDIPQSTLASNPNEVAVLIDGERFRFWSDIRITLAIDSISTIELTAPFDANNADFRAAFVPFSFKSLTVTVGGAVLFTGVTLGINPVLGNTRKTVSLSAYSLPGVLNDCTPPANAYPLEFDGQGLREVATTLAGPFGLEVVFDADQGAIFERVAIEPGTRVLSFLSKLAKQRNLIMSSTPTGALRFLQSNPATVPVARLSQGSSPVLAVVPSFNPQEYYSSITGLEPVVVGLGGSQFTVRNPILSGVVRPFTYNIPDTISADVKSAVEAKASRMFGNMVSYSVDVATWRDPNGALWTPNTTVKLIAPDAMVYTEYAFIVRGVVFERTSVDELAILDLVIPGSFSGTLPEVLPWD